jgi:PAS domain S-box-containing protein
MVVSRRSLGHYAGSVAIIVLATLARLALDPVLHDRGALITYYFAVALVAWLGGLGPGLLSLVLGGLAAAFFFMPPRGTLLMERTENQVGLGLYFVTGMIIVVLAEAQRSARRKAEASALEAIDQQSKLKAEIVRREQVERELEGLMAEQARLRVVAEDQSATLATLLDLSPIAIVLYDADLRHVRVNSQAPALIGLTPDQVIGRTLREVLEGRIPAARIDELERPFRRTLETGEPFSIKAWDSGIERPVGGSIYLDWSIRRVDRPEGGMPGLLGTFVDVTEDIARGRALRQNEERFRLAAEAVNGLIYDANLITGHVERTRGLFEMLGYQPEEVPPTVDWWFEKIHPDDLGRMLDVSAGEWNSWSRVSNEYRVRHRDGHYVHLVDRSLSEVDGAGNLIRTVGCSQDVTEIRKAEQALREADARKNEFLAVLAHEIRNPLATIRNALRLMKRPDVDLDDGDGRIIAIDPEAEREMAERQVAHLARLVDDLMDVSRISRGRVELRKEPIELAGIVDRAVEAIRSSVDRRGQALSVELPPAPIRLEADPTRLEQVFGNLLSNAVKYTPPGGRIAISAREEGGEAVLTVVDNGLGMSAEMMPKIFEMFVQDGQHSGHSQGGLGIGLGLSRSLVELHGGRISARSDGPGAGSEFEVRLPLANGGLPSPNGPRRNGRADRPSAAPRRRVLVVDDNENLALSLARLLERIYKQEVRVAHDGPSALEMLEEFRPELILLDIGMPVMDGCEVARQIRARPEFAQTLLVALTGWGQEADRKRSEEAGIDRHLVKPVDPDILGELIASSRA